MRNLFFFLIVSILLSACQPSATSEAQPSPTPPPVQPQDADNPYAPQDADMALERADVFLNSVDLLEEKTAPYRVVLALTGALPTPCHQLRVKVALPSPEGDIQVQIYSVYKNGQICVQVLKEFNTSVTLGTYPDGQYQVYVNGQYIGNFSH